MDGLWEGLAKRPLNRVRKCEGQTDQQTNKQTYGRFDFWKESAQRVDSLKMQVSCSNGLEVMMSCDT